MTTVEKIGGTSMSRFEDVLRNIMLRDPHHVYGRVYVVSAYAGVTNQLLEHKKTGEPGIYARFAAGTDYAAALDALVARLVAINHELAPVGLPLDVANGFIERCGHIKASRASARTLLVCPTRFEPTRVSRVVRARPGSRPDPERDARASDELRDLEPLADQQCRGTHRHDWNPVHERHRTRNAKRPNASRPPNKRGGARNRCKAEAHHVQWLELDVCPARIRFGQREDYQRPCEHAERGRPEGLG